MLRATGETIRSFCGWHIAPSITEQLENLEIGSNGIIVLPSLYVTDVSSIVVQYSQEDEPTTLDPAGYRWFRQGFIEPVASQYVSTWGYLPNTTGGYATVTFTHGYEALPDDVKQVCFELAGWTAAMPTGGDMKTIASPGFHLTLRGQTSPGMNLNDDQKSRLANYTLSGPGAVK